MGEETNARDDGEPAEDHYAVRLEHGRRPLPADRTRRLADALARLAADASARRPALPAATELSTRSAGLADFADQLHAGTALFRCGMT
jgi:hypothetical protein